jgi:hypothetical protein
MMPVDGECNAATALSAGSIARAAAPSIRCTSLTPFACACACSASSAGSSLSSTATTSLPQRRWAMPRSAQYAYSAWRPSTHSRAFSEPGA